MSSYTQACDVVAHVLAPGAGENAPADVIDALLRYPSLLAGLASLAEHAERRAELEEELEE